MTLIKYKNLSEFIVLNNSKITEIKNQYINLLKNLTITEDITVEEFINKIYEISKIGNIVIAYIKCDINFKIVGSGTVIIEPKIIHSCKSVAHIEDIVVHPDYRGQGIAKNIISTLKNISITKNCYKIILNCIDEYIPVYKKCEFVEKGYEMALYL